MRNSNFLDHSKFSNDVLEILDFQGISEQKKIMVSPSHSVKIAHALIKYGHFGPVIFSSST